MFSAGPKHTFVRPSVGVDSHYVLSTNDAIHRIHSLRKSLSGIVSSRASSAERFTSPRPAAPPAESIHAESAAHEPVANTLLLESQRRVEDLMRDKHRLERVCLEYEDQLRAAYAELQSLKGQTFVSHTGARSNAKTPSLSRRGKSVLKDLPTPGALDDQSIAPLHPNIRDALHRLIARSVSVFPELKPTLTGDSTDEWDTILKVLAFTESHLPEWSRLAQECNRLGEENTELAQTFHDVGDGTLSWAAELIRVIERLRAVQSEHRRALRRRERHARDMYDKIKFLEIDLAQALDDLEESRGRCSDLEQALCVRVAEPSVERQAPEEKQSAFFHAREPLQGEIHESITTLSNTITTPMPTFSSAPLREGGLLCKKSGDPVLPLCGLSMQPVDDSTDAGFSHTSQSVDNEDICRTSDTAELLDVNKPNRSIRRLSMKKDALKKKLESRDKALVDAQNREQAWETEKEHLTAQVKTLQAEIEEHAKVPLRTESSSCHLHSAALPPLQILPTSEPVPNPLVRELSHIIRLFDLDVTDLCVTDQANIFYHINCAIVADAGFCTNDAISHAWERFIQQIQFSYINDEVYYNAIHAADVGQFFYALLRCTGLADRMTKAELAAAVIVGFSLEYRRADFLARLKASDSHCFYTLSKDCASIFEPCCFMDICKILARDGFRLLPDTSNDPIIAEMEALLLSPVVAHQAVRIAQLCRSELQEGSLDLDNILVRRRYTRLFLILASYAFTMRSFSICETWGERLLQNQNLYESGSHSYTEPVYNVAEAQLQLIDLTIIPLCEALVMAFPVLLQCESSLRVNRQKWASQCLNWPQRGELKNPEHCMKENISTTPGSVLVDSACFTLAQRELISLYDENVTLRQSLSALLQAVECAPQREGNFSGQAESKMSTLELCKEYLISRSRDPVMCSWVFGSLTVLAVAIATAPGRRAAKTIEPRKTRVSSPRVTDSPSPNIETKRSRLHEFLYLLRIAVPRLHSEECGMLIIISLLLLLRTYLSMKISFLSGHLSKTVISCNSRNMLKAIVNFLLWSIPAALTNSSVSYSVGMLQIRMQTNLGQYFHREYLKNAIFYRLAISSRLNDVDQRITEDIEKWSIQVAGLYTSLFKPIVDTIIFSYRLAKTSGVRTPLGVVAYYTGFALLLYKISPNMELVVSRQLEHEGAFVANHQRLIPYAEEIVFSQGQSFHQHLLGDYLGAIIRHSEWSSYAFGRYALVEKIFVKHGSSILGYAVCASSVFSKSADGMSTPDLMGLIVETSFLFKNFSLAVGQLLRSLRTFFVVQSLSRRIYELDEEIEHVRAEIFRDTGNESPADFATLLASPTGFFDRLSRGEHIEFDHVPLVLPTGEVLCKELSFFVKPGMNLLIVGPNGCGKSSTMRLLSGLWPIQGGRITKPKNDQIYYVPQRPYMSTGSLRDQITYPKRSNEINVSESTLLDCLEMAMLDDIFFKPNVTWDSHLAWSGDILSMGEKQKLAMARLFFHKPRFAILDECSSMISIEVEERLYSACRQLGISLLTIAHRVSVWRHHNWILRFDGCGNFLFSPLTFDGNGGMILRKVVHASDPDMIGRELRFDMPLQSSD